MKYMLDTDICSYAIKGNPEVIARMIENRGEYCISSVVYQELMTGLLASKGSKYEERYVQLLRGLKTIPFTQSDSIHAADLANSMRKSGIPLHGADIQIAGHAMCAGLTLVSNNTRHYGRISGLELANWVER